MQADTFAPILAARAAIAPPNTNASEAFRALLAACAPNSPMHEEEFHRCARAYSVSKNTTLMMQYRYLNERCIAHEAHYDNGNIAIWSTAGYLAYRFDPRF